jgi:hypothetical protein
MMMKSGRGHSLMVAAWRTVSVSSAVLLLGCRSPEEQACLDMADAFGEAAERCNGDYEDNRDYFIGAVASGDCGNITWADTDGVYDSCIPYLEHVPCSELLYGEPDPRMTCSARFRQ